MYLQNKNLFLLSLVSGIAVAPLAYATEETKDPYEENLSSHWGGARDKLAEAGVDVTIEYKADFWNVASGGIKRGSNYDDNLDVKFALDGEKLFGIQGNKALIYFINNNGSHPNDSRIGSQQGIDNIEVVKDTPKLYEAWVDQSFWGGMVSILAGLHDLNSEFVETDSTANFIKPVMQIGQEFAQTGQNGPSIFPNAALAARLKVAPTAETYVQGAVFDAIAGDPDHLYGTHVKFGGGALLIAEAGYTPKSEGEGTLNKFAVGAWSYTQKTDDLVDVDTSGNPVKNRSEGIYLLSSYQFYSDKDGRSGVAFFRPGIADGDTAPVEWAYEAGVVGHGWVPSRPDSEIGLGISQARNSNKGIQAALAAGSPIERNECGLELYYRDKLYPGISLQPDLQYIVNPSADPHNGNATVVGMRVDINF